MSDPPLKNTECSVETTAPGTKMKELKCWYHDFLSVTLGKLLNLSVS